MFHRWWERQCERELCAGAERTESADGREEAKGVRGAGQHGQGPHETRLPRKVCPQLGPPPLTAPPSWRVERKALLKMARAMWEAGIERTRRGQTIRRRLKAIEALQQAWFTHVGRKQQGARDALDRARADRAKEDDESARRMARRNLYLDEHGWETDDSTDGMDTDGPEHEYHFSEYLGCYYRYT